MRYLLLGMVMISSLACATRQQLPSRPPARVSRPERTRVTQVNVPFRIRQRVARVGGGAFVLGDGGQLARVDARGRVNDISQTPLRDLSVTSSFVCGRAQDAQLYCLIDHHEDATCDDAPPPLLMRVNAPSAVSLSWHAASGLFCEQGGASSSRCFTIHASCERHCLAWPACAALRCIDPCPAHGIPELRALPASSKIFFAAQPSAVTDG